MAIISPTNKRSVKVTDERCFFIMPSIPLETMRMLGVGKNGIIVYMVIPTKKQKIMLDYIDGFVKSNGYSPTFREIMQALEYKSVSTVAKHVDNLIARGWLVKRENEARSLEVVMPGSEPANKELDEQHRQWLTEIVRQKELAGMTEKDQQVVSRALEVLGLSKEV